jgi:membrane protein implicated in regulation of membrane protease activity
LRIYALDNESRPYVQVGREGLSMCHIILSLPILALSLFFFLPLMTALSIYLVITGASVFVYYKIIAVMRTKVQTGMEGMIGEDAEVIEDINPKGRIRLGGELWRARARDGNFRRGERVRICGVQGMEVIVETPHEVSSQSSWETHCKPAKV